MGFVQAGANQYLVVGRRGKLENRGAAVQAFLLPGTVYALVPSTRQETSFEFTQETQDGVPLRFKGIVIYRITDPVTAAHLFDFTGGDGIGQMNAMLAHICLGELRDAVSHMTMARCIEERKTTLSETIEKVLRQTSQEGSPTGFWGIDVEVAQVAQVFIVDGELRRQLEAEARNDIKTRSEQSDIRAHEEIEASRLLAEGRLQEHKLAADKENLLRKEQMRLAEIASQRRMQQEKLETGRLDLQFEQELHRLQNEAELARVEADTPLRLLRAEREGTALHAEIECRRLLADLKAQEAAIDLAADRAAQELRKDILPLEQLPALADAASKVLQGATLSIYGEDSKLLGTLTPLFDLLTRALRQSANKADGDAA